MSLGRKAKKGNPNFALLRKRMVEEQLRRSAIQDERVLEAMMDIPRHEFVNPPDISVAYHDRPIPIGFGQTISQPFIVAFMTAELNIQPSNSILEIGTGCGYQSAILGKLGKHVTSIERIPGLANNAGKILKKLGFDNVDVITGDGYKGWREKAPYDRIMVTAAPKRIPKALTDQLAINGRMIIPVGSTVFTQSLWIITKDEKGVVRKRKSLGVRFVPMVEQ